MILDRRNFVKRVGLSAAGASVLPLLKVPSLFASDQKAPNASARSPNSDFYQGLVERERINLLTGKRYTWLTRPGPGPGPDLPCDGCVGGFHQGWGYLNYPQTNSTALAHGGAYGALVQRRLTQTQWNNMLALLAAWVSNLQYCGGDEIMRTQVLASGILQYPGHQQVPTRQDLFEEVGTICGGGAYWGDAIGMDGFTSGNFLSGLEGNYNCPDGYDFTLNAYLNQIGGVSAMTSDLQNFFTTEVEVNNGTFGVSVSQQTWDTLDSIADNMMAIGGVLEYGCQLLEYPPTSAVCLAGIAAVGAGGLTWMALHDGLINPH